MLRAMRWLALSGFPLLLLACGGDRPDWDGVCDALEQRATECNSPTVSCGRPNGYEEAECDNEDEIAATITDCNSRAMCSEWTSCLKGVPMCAGAE